MVHPVSVEINCDTSHLNNQDTVTNRFPAENEGRTKGISNNFTGQMDFSLEDRDFRMGFSWAFRIFFIEMSWMSWLIQKNILNQKIKLDIRHIPSLEPSQKVENQY